MPTRNLIIETNGKIEYGSGDGNPDHVSPKGSFYIDNDTSDLYNNTDGTSTGWTSVLKRQSGEFYLSSNSSASATTANVWVGVQGNVTASSFSSNSFTFSRQVQILSATGDGGFANTTVSGTGGFSTNGWIVTNGTQNSKWYVGATGASGSGFGAYISGTGNGADNFYSNSPSGVPVYVYFYRDVVVPALVTSLDLSFSFRGGGESTFDLVRVFSVASSQVFTAGTLVAGGSLDVNFTQPVSVLATSWNVRTVSLTVPVSAATQSRRIAFMWTNDGSARNQPGASIDNISLVANLPVSFTYTGSQSTFRSLLTGSFQATSAISNVGVIISKNGQTVSNLSETSYNIGTNIKDSFSTQNTFTMSNGDTIQPLINNKVSSTSITINDLYLGMWEVD